MSNVVPNHHQRREIPKREEREKQQHEFKYSLGTFLAMCVRLYVSSNEELNKTEGLLSSYNND